MIIIHKDRSYTSNKKYVQGLGFIDSLSSSLRNIGSYVSQNRDLIAKPMLGAVGNLAALGISKGGKALLTKMMNKNEHKSNKNSQTPGSQSAFQNTQLDSKSIELLQSLMKGSTDKPTSGMQSTANIIGSGIKKF
jgi:hypothetical protein